MSKETLDDFSSLFQIFLAWNIAHDLGFQNIFLDKEGNIFTSKTLPEFKDDEFIFEKFSEDVLSITGRCYIDPIQTGYENRHSNTTKMISDMLDRYPQLKDILEAEKFRTHFYANYADTMRSPDEIVKYDFLSSAPYSLSLEIMKEHSKDYWNKRQYVECSGRGVDRKVKLGIVNSVSYGTNIYMEN